MKQGTGNRGQESGRSREGGKEGTREGTNAAPLPSTLPPSPIHNPQPTTYNLHAENLTYTVRHNTLLERVSCAFEPGKLSVVLGPNGAGKSTLLKLLLGWLRPSSGRVRLCGEPLERLKPLERASRMAYLAQSEPLPEELRVRDFVALGRPPRRGLLSSPLSGLRPEDEAAIHRALERTQTLALADTNIGPLSGGERQRVALARALAQLEGVAGPRFLLLDEPTNHLDLAHQTELLHKLRLEAGGGVGVVLVLHDLSVAFQADHVLLLERGRVLAQGAPQEVLTPQNIFLAYGLEVDLHRVGGRTVVLPR